MATEGGLGDLSFQCFHSIDTPVPTQLSSGNIDVRAVFTAKARVQVSDLNMAPEVKQHTVLIYRQLDLAFSLIIKWVCQGILLITINASAPPLGLARKCTWSRSCFPLFFCVADLSAALMKI